MLKRMKRVFIKAFIIDYIHVSRSPKGGLVREAEDFHTMIIAGGQSELNMQKIDGGSNARDQLQK